MESTSQSCVTATDADEKNYAPTEREMDEFTAISDEDDDYNMLLWQAFADPPPYAPTERETDEFTAISDEDDDYNMLLWQAFAGPPPSIPKKGNFVVYFPQGHLEYAASAYSSSVRSIKAPTFDLKPEIICRVVHVQFLVSQKNDKVYTKMTLHPTTEMVGVNLKGKELEELVVDVKGDGGSPAKSTPPLFSQKLSSLDKPDSTPCLFYKKLTVSDKAERILIPTKDAENVLPSLGNESLLGHFSAKDVHGTWWNFLHVVKGKSRLHYVIQKGKKVVSRKNLVPGDTMVFIRGEDMKMRLGIKRAIHVANGDPDPIIRKHNTFPNVLSPVADAISNESTFDVIYSPRASNPEFVICYQKYMKSIRKPVNVGEKFQMQSEMDDSPGKRRSGIVTGTCDLDPNRWPNSKWRCLQVRWDEETGNCEEQVCPWWEIDCSLSLPSLINLSHRLKRPQIILEENSPATSATGDVKRPFDLGLQYPVLKNPVPFTLFPGEEIDCSHSLPSTTTTHSSPRLKRLRTNLQENSPATSATAGMDFLQSSSALEGEASDCAIITGDVSRPFDLELPFPAHHLLDLNLPAPIPKNSLDEDVILRITPGDTLEYLEIDSLSSLASFLRSEVAASTVKQLKINKCPNLEVPIHRMACTSIEYLEFNGCQFFSYSKRDSFPSSLKRLKICHCTNTELILKILMDQQGLSLEYLEIYSCSSLDAFQVNKLPATLRRLKIVHCMNLKSLSESSKIINFDSVVAGPEGDSRLENMTSTQTLELREFEIWDCAELEFLPEGLHNFTCLNLLSISNCPSLESFPEGGLPNTSLRSLLISECENLKSLPYQIHKVTSLQNLSISGCPSLMFFPQGGLPPNLITLGIIDCENLIPLSHWELHKLKHLRNYSIVGGRPDLGD